MNRKLLVLIFIGVLVLLVLWYFQVNPVYGLIDPPVQQAKTWLTQNLTLGTGTALLSGAGGAAAVGGWLLKKVKAEGASEIAKVQDVKALAETQLGSAQTEVERLKMELEAKTKIYNEQITKLNAASSEKESLIADLNKKVDESTLALSDQVAGNKLLVDQKAALEKLLSWADVKQ